MLALCLQSASDQIEQPVIWLAVLAFPMTPLGAWAGTLGLLLLSGVGLVWSSLR